MKLLGIMDVTSMTAKIKEALVDDEIDKMMTDYLRLFGNYFSFSSESSIIERLRNVYKNNSILLGQFSPSISSGDMEYFRSTKSDFNHSSWKPFISGEILVHDINYEHMYRINQSQ